jgi:predicted transcriptional regulator
LIKPKALKWTEFKPHEESLTKVLGDLEADVMEALWNLQEAQVRDIHKEISQKRKVAVTTVATILDRLHEKGFVGRTLKKSRSVYYEYRPLITREQLENTVVRDVLKGLFETFSEPVVSYLVDSSGLEDAKKIEEFRQNLENIGKRKAAND